MIPRKTFTAFFAAIFLATIGFSYMLENNKSKEIKSFFPNQKSWELKRFAITDDKDKTLVFKRINCVWVIGDDNLPSDEIKVTALAEKLITLKSDDLVTENEGDYERLKVSTSQFSFKIEFSFKDETSRTLLLWKADMGRPSHARRADESGVYLIYEPMLAEIKLDTKEWVNSVDEVSGLSKQ